MSRPNPAYEGFPAGDRDAPPSFPGGPPDRFDRTPLTPVPYSGEGHASGANEVANGESNPARNRDGR